MGRRVFRNYYKGLMDKTKGDGGSMGGKWVWLGWGENADKGLKSKIYRELIQLKRKKKIFKDNKSYSLYY